ncbi:hypothetical protein [Pseudoduganella sp.]|uniref:hypothetical protein n=1 Tax=Pseudoduganella sp. TaxID=1880898 RepID=UPI0035AFD6A6
MRLAVLSLLLSGAPVFPLAAELACSGADMPDVKSSIPLEAPKPVGSEFLPTAVQLLGDATITAVEPALVGLAAMPGQTQYLLRAAAFSQAPQRFTARVANGKVYVTAHILGSRRAMEPVVLTLSSPVELTAVECLTSAAR